MEQQLRFSVLGPVRAWRDETEVLLGPPQQRAVLTTLLLAEGAQVSMTKLSAAVWGNEAPASAPGILRGYIHRLRKALDPVGDPANSAIRSIGDGYQLGAAFELDLHRFRDLCAQAKRARGEGDIAGAVKLFREVNSLWHGTPLADVRGDYAQQQRMRLTELWLSATADRLTAELDLGHLTEAVAELADLVAEHPLDERFRELLMLAYYRSGRQAAALDTYRDTRALLAEELGVDPGQALQTLYQRVLQADSTLLSAPPPPDSAPENLRSVPVPAQLPPVLPVFVGRQAELARATALSASGTVIVSAVAGTAGVGKTAFAVHWAHQVAYRFPDGQLYVNLRGFDPVGLPVTPEHALRTLLESLGADIRALPQDLDALAATYRTHIAGRRLLLLLDNARDAAQVRPLLPATPGTLAIVTSRDRLTGLIAVDSAHPLQLDVLTAAEARSLLARRLGTARVDAEPDAVDEIISRCACLPLALAVTAARAATRPGFPLTALAAELRDSAADLDAFQDDGDTAADVRAVFSWSYHALTPEAARLFRLLALHPGPDTTAPAAASLVGHPLPQTRRLLAQLVQAHLLDETAPGRYASHDLLRNYAGELTQTFETPAQVRAARYRVLDHYLHTAHAAAALTNLARALVPLDPVAEGVRPEEFDGNAGKATAWFTAEQAVLIAAVEQAAAHGNDTHTWRLAWAISNYLHLRGLWQEEEAAQRAALEAARRLDDQRAEAYAHRGLGLAMAGLGHFDEAASEARRAIKLCTDTGDLRAAAESYRVLAWSLEQQGDLEGARDGAQRSLALFRACEGKGADNIRSRTAIASALNAVGWNEMLLGRPQEALDHCLQALALCQELGDATNAAHTWDTIGCAHHHLGQHAEAVDAFQRALGLYRLQGDLPWFVASTLTHLGDTQLSAGTPEAARVAWTEALAIMDHLGHSDAESLRKRLNPEERPAATPEESSR
ncbi:DNA-binding SARP family transcriptional activator [Streptomyces sp. 3330]|uniref:AfsR/SARP family transcriptional regulator n=1 Tax=Streptomyces sp. 3330 TaxID=2817755 RepID=UPI0028668893|nr:BTAD domain-containing putative transcriptional regulator [Streptomyces sp. 3330]MDR6981281.1 DNA-binding SARP family transcriptional activator [Streptomyces sp. 3330]